MIQPRHGRVERDCHLLAGRVPGGPDCLDQDAQGLLVRREVRREPSLVPDGGGHPAVVEHPLERLEHLVGHPQGVAKGPSPDGDDHELLKVDAVVGVRAAVDHVQHRHGEHVCALAPEVAPQRQPLLRRGGVGCGE